MLAYDLPKKKQSQPHKNEQLIAYVLCVETQEEKGSVLSWRYGKGILTDYMWHTQLTCIASIHSARNESLSVWRYHDL